jgi:L-serine/L-threonine ammonia-lyase
MEASYQQDVSDPASPKRSKVNSLPPMAKHCGNNADWAMSARWMRSQLGGPSACAKAPFMPVVVRSPPSISSAAAPSTTTQLPSTAQPPLPSSTTLSTTATPSSSMSALTQVTADEHKTLTELAAVGSATSVAACSARLYTETPLVRSTQLSELLDAEVLLKLELLQPSGSFKMRGVSEFCRQAVANGAEGLVSSSGGNAGVAAALSGQLLGVPVVVVVPHSTSERVRADLRRLGARVEAHGAVWDEADARARALVDASAGRLVAVHPFGHPLLHRGHATLVAELRAQLYALGHRQPDAVLLSVGGGGLLVGVCEGMRAAGWDHVPVVAVETSGAASLRASVLADRLVTLEGIRSRAKTLGACTVSPRALEEARRRPVYSTLVSDRHALRGTLHLVRTHRLVTELSCGATVGAALRMRHDPLLADLLGASAEKGRHTSPTTADPQPPGELPDGVPTTVPPRCVPVPATPEAAQRELASHRRCIVLIVCGGTGITHHELVALEHELFPAEPPPASSSVGASAVARRCSPASPPTM